MDNSTHKEKQEIKAGMLIVILMILLLITAIWSMTIKNQIGEEKLRAEYYKNQTINIYKLAKIEKEALDYCLEKNGIEKTTNITPLEEIMID